LTLDLRGPFAIFLRSSRRVAGAAAELAARQQIADRRMAQLAQN
jgi:hypothetical protein